MSLPTVSALIHTYNYGRFVGDAIDSVLAQDYPADRLEVIVLDDGSEDDTREVVRPYEDRVRYIRQGNTGTPGACNRSIAAATGELIAFHSGDDAWKPDKTIRQVEILQARPEVGLVYADLAITDGGLNVMAPSFWRRFGFAPRRGKVLPHLLRGNFISGTSMMFRASFRDVICPIPDWAYWEDWWIATRVAETGAEVEFIDEALVLYRWHGANCSLYNNDGSPGRAMNDWIAQRYPGGLPPI